MQIQLYGRQIYIYRKAVDFRQSINGLSNLVKMEIKHNPQEGIYLLSAILNRLNPRLYVQYLMTKVHDIRRGIIDPITLLPHIINQNNLKTFSDQLLADAKKILDTS
jgi:hypothetical protein